MRLGLPADEIHLWCAYADTAIDHDTAQHDALRLRYRALLTEAERSQESRFRFAEDAGRYLLTRALVRTVLSRYAPVAPQDWRFETNAQGKPRIANPEALDADLSFNLSHTQGLVVLAVAAGMAVGVDVEYMGCGTSRMEVAAACFSAAEYADLQGLAGAAQNQRFFQYWTLKESYTKARGLGLDIPLQQVSFQHQPPHGVSLSLHPSLRDVAARWAFWQFQPTAQHMVALCAEHQVERVMTPVWKRTIPLQDEAWPMQVERVRT
ncbi:phosphopantetheinyl transferase [Rhodoferax lacus]|uniref:Phosphopantetheinyl transferase n=1 Tax=Rhodoferax lacus TaxID=2184758 RepID=A0A3E1R5P8_9BURK|nr:4'-phosphopantetheinyl transferase superfamily protein [Rhodoferax lacus]RFO94708.1 phosphopantetheinyl transferase [Rhodoferax lacus]